MDDGELAAQIRLRPAIWDPRDAGHADPRRNRAAWLAVCRLAHPEFDRLAADDKRDKCLALQKRWMDMRQAYFRSARGPRRRASQTTAPAADPELVAKLAFLADAVTESTTIEIVDTDAADARSAPAVKRNRSSSAASASSSAASASSSAASASSSAASASASAVSASASAAPASASAVSASASAAPASSPAVSTSTSADEDEDRHFLLSLVSYVQEVPRRQRLALRRDMLELIARYAAAAEDAAEERHAAPNQR